MANPEEQLRRLGEPFPAEAIKRREGRGRQGFDYLEAETVIRRLNNVTPDWSWTIDRFDLIPYQPDGRGGNQQLAIVIGRLTIPGLGTRSGIGVQVIGPNSGEDLVKGASSDGLKKAATLFGVGLDLYGPAFEGDGTVSAGGREQRPIPPRHPATTIPYRNSRPAPAPAPGPEPDEGEPGSDGTIPPMTEDDIAFMDRAERARSAADWRALMDEAGDREARWFGLIAAAPTVAYANRIRTLGRERGVWTMRLERGYGERLEELRRPAGVADDGGRG